MIYPWIRDFYGQVCGYDRLRIRAEVRRNARLASEELDALSRRLLAARVVDAVRRFPAYAEKLRSNGVPVPERETDVRLEKLPVWTREDQNRAFGASSVNDLGRVFVHASGGSSGVPVRFRLTRGSYEWRTAVADRGYAWAGAEEGRRVFFVWGAPVDKASIGTRVKQWIHHTLQRRVLFDSFVLDERRLADCCERIRRFRPEAIVGYAGNLVELARFAREHTGALQWKARTVITAAEGLQPGQRELLQEQLGSEVFMSYGSREFMLIGMECRRHRGYHLAMDNVWVEVVDDAGRPAPAGESGRILVTDLRNPATPFIRYEIGDTGRMAAECCDCGLPFPVLAGVEGRLQECIRTPDGARVSALFLPHLMKEFAWVEGYQVAQLGEGDIEVRLLSQGVIVRERALELERALRERLGRGILMRIVRVDGLTRSANGKTPIVVTTGDCAGSEGRPACAG